MPSWAPRHLVGFLALLVVLAVALAIGSGLGAGHPLTPSQRAGQLEAQVRCPSCDDISVAQSNTPSALAVRQEIAVDVARGESGQAILNAIVGQYGPTILLRPSTTGFISLVWFVPIVGGAGALAGLGVLFVRRSREIARLRRQEP